VEAQRAQLSRNLARTREGASADFESQVIAAMQNMENEDYQRKLTADQNNNNTQLQLYASQQAEDQFAQNLALKREQMAQEQKQFEDQMWYNREKEGLGWSTAEDAKKAAAEAAANAAKGVNGTESPNGTGTPGLHTTGYSPGYDSVGPTTGANTGAGNTGSNKRRKTPAPTTATTRDWSASFNGNNLTTPLTVTTPASTPLISGSGITRNVSTVHSTLNLPNQPDRTTANRLVKKDMR